MLRPSSCCSYCDVIGGIRQLGDGQPGQCYMFRSKRNSLVKRLWKHRVTSNEAEGTAETPDDLELKSVAQSMLKRLKERHLEMLIQAVESRGGETMGCVLLPKGEIRLPGRKPVSPHVLCCQIWRWPSNDQEYTLKRVPCCDSTTTDPTSVCCNPYHWSRLISPGLYQNIV